MRSIALLLGTLLLPVVANAQCSSAADVPVAEVSFAPTCIHSNARVAANANGALSMWGSSHTGFSMVTYWMSGTVLDSAGAPRRLPEHLYQYGSATPELATDGHDYLLAWADGSAAYARIIDADGHAGGDAVRVSDGLPKAGEVRVVWNGTSYTFVTTSHGSAIAVEISATGRMMGSDGIAAGATPLAIAAAAPDRVAVLLRTPTGIESAIIDGTTRIGEPVTLPVASNSGAIAIASNGPGFLVVSRTEGQVSALLLDSRGGAATPALALGAGNGETAVVWEGGSYLALWSDNNGGVNAARLNGDGSLRSQFRAADGSLASAAFNGSGTIVLTRVSCNSVASTFLARGSETGPTRDVSLAAISQSAPKIVETARGYQLFWQENGLFTRFVSREGTFSESKRISPTGTLVARHGAVHAGNATIVVWDEYANGQLPAVLRAARFDDEGNELGSTVITNAWFIFGLSVASSGSDVVVAWTQEPQNSNRLDVFAARVNADGAVSVPPTQLSMPSDEMYEVVAGADPSGAIVAWRNGSSTIVSLEVGSQLEVLRRREVSPSSSVLFPLAAAIRDDRSLVLWWSADDDGLIRMQAMDQDGTVAAISTGFGIPLSVKLAPRGDGWLIYFARFERDASTNEILQRVLVSNGAFGAPEQLLCAPGDLDYTLRGDAPAVLTYSAPTPSLEGASRVYFRNSFPPRRRSAR